MFIFFLLRRVCLIYFMLFSKDITYSHWKLISKYKLKNNLQFEEDLTLLQEMLSNTEYHIYPTPPLGQDMTQGQFFKRSLTGLNSEFSFS